MRGNRSGVYNPQNGVRFPDGTLVVLDKGPQQLVVIDPHDSITARFARSGHGPGEIQGNGVALIALPDRTFYAVEMWGNVRIHHFSLTGELISDHRMQHSGEFPWGPGRTPLELTIALWTRAGDAYVDSLARLDVETGAIQTFAPLPPRFPPSPGGGLLFYPIALWTSFATGGVITGMTDSGTLQYHAADGSLKRVIHLPLNPRKVTEESKALIVEEYRSFLAANTPAGERDRFYSHFRIALRMFTLNDSVFAMGHKWFTSPAEDPVAQKDTYILRLYECERAPGRHRRAPAGVHALDHRRRRRARRPDRLTRGSERTGIPTATDRITAKLSA